MGALLRVLASAAAALPWRWLRLPGMLLGWIAGSVLRIRRSHVEAAMRLAGIVDPSHEADAMFRSLGRSAMELLHLAGGRSEAIERVRIDASSRARWDEALGQGRGVIVAASHTGNWDLAACAIAREVELLVVTKRLTVRSIDAFWQSIRAAQGVSLAESKGALARARGVLARGGAVAMMIDQVPASSGHAIDAQFLGKSALVDRGPAVLAAACRAPLVVAVSRREVCGAHVLLVLDVLEPPRRPSQAWVTFATESATRRLDHFVRTYPSQWLWLHRRWKQLDDRSRGPVRSLASLERADPTSPVRSLASLERADPTSPVRSLASLERAD